MIGTNRLKTEEEITKSALQGFNAVKPLLDKLKKGETVSLHGSRRSEKPPADLAKLITDYIEKIGLKAQ